MRDIPAIKPCPFCGCKDVTGPSITNRSDSSVRDVWIECDNCAATISYGYGRGVTDEVAKFQVLLAWNNRSEP